MESAKALTMNSPCENNIEKRGEGCELPLRYNKLKKNQ